MTATLKTHTLDTLRQRCVEEGDCLIWQGYAAHNNVPMVYAAHPAAGKGRSGKNVSVRWLVALLHGDQAALDELQPGAAKGHWRAHCGTPNCVEHSHITRYSGRDHLVAIARIAHENTITNALRAERISRTQRARVGKVDTPTMRDAVADHRSASAMAKELGVSKSSVARWRQRARARVTGSMFGQLMAR